LANSVTETGLDRPVRPATVFLSGPESTQTRLNYELEKIGQNPPKSAKDELRSDWNFHKKSKTEVRL